MELEPGVTIWLPCEVKLGPFSNERMVRLEWQGGEWVGFVHVGALKEKITSGETFVSARITTVVGKKFFARVSGHSVGEPRQFEGAVDQLDAVPA